MPRPAAVRRAVASPVRGSGATSAPPLTWAGAGGWPRGAGWQFVLPVLTSANRVWRVGKGRAYMGAQGKADRANAALVLPKALLSGDVAVSITWYRARRSGDVDNRVKATLDLLRGIAYADDASVARLTIERVDDGSPARLVVDVAPMTAPIARNAA